MIEPYTSSAPGEAASWLSKDDLAVLQHGKIALFNLAIQLQKRDWLSNELVEAIEGLGLSPSTRRSCRSSPCTFISPTADEPSSPCEQYVARRCEMRSGNSHGVARRRLRHCENYHGEPSFESHRHLDLPASGRESQSSQQASSVNLSRPASQAFDELERTDV